MRKETPNNRSHSNGKAKKPETNSLSNTEQVGMLQFEIGDGTHDESQINHKSANMNKEVKGGDNLSSIKSSINSTPKENDFSKFRLSQDFASQIGVKKVITTVHVRKPSRHEFIRVLPDEKWQMSTALLELKEEKEQYLVTPELMPELSEFTTPTHLFTAINRQKVLMLWPVKISGIDGRYNSWNESSLEAAKLAMDRWVRVAGNMSLSAYEVFEAQGKLSDPEWPGSEMSFYKLLDIAFRGRIIDSFDHPVVRNLRGLE